MKVIKVGLLGMGTVGSGVFEVLKNNAAEISRRAGCTIQIGRVVVRDPEEVRTLVGPDICLLYTSPSPRDRQKSRMQSSA